MSAETPENRRKGVFQQNRPIADVRNLRNKERCTAAMLLQELRPIANIMLLGRSAVFATHVACRYTRNDDVAKRHDREGFAPVRGALPRRLGLSGIQRCYRDQWMFRPLIPPTDLSSRARSQGG